MDIETQRGAGNWQAHQKAGVRNPSLWFYGSKPGALLIIPHCLARKRKCHKFALGDPGSAVSPYLETGYGNEWMWRLPHAHGSPSSMFSQSPACRAGWREQSNILLPSPSPPSLCHCSVSGHPAGVPGRGWHSLGLPGLQPHLDFPARGQWKPVSHLKEVLSPKQEVALQTETPCRISPGPWDKWPG